MLCQYGIYSILSIGLIDSDAAVIFDLLERLSSLTRAWFREHPSLSELQPTQFSALMYLARCNRYSDTPLAVAEYLGLTKGTVSQSLKILENKGFICKVQDDRDKRSVHLELTKSARLLVESVMPPAFLVSAEMGMGKRARELERLLIELLQEIQRAEDVSSFGLCGSCRHHEVSDEGEFCDLTGQPLAEQEFDLICVEHAHRLEDASP